MFAWIAAEALIVHAELPEADAIVVLSGSSAYKERAEHAARLFREGRAPRVVLTNDNLRSGWSSAQQRNPFFSERASDELKRAGVPAEQIEVLPTAVSSTYEEATLLREYAKGRGLRSILVVTSAYHSRRALWTLRFVFQQSGVKIGLSPAPAGEQTPRPAFWWLSAGGWRMVGGEYLKFAYYCYELRG